MFEQLGCCSYFCYTEEYMRRSHGVSFIFLLVLFIIGYFFVQKPQEQQVTTPSQSQVLSAVDVNAKCHAKFLNASDPQAVFPDPKCTPGSLNSAVTQQNIDQTICKSGYTKTIRPPESYTYKLKKEQIAAYGYHDTSTRSYEEDHFISLELGGNPSDPKNLWPEPHGSPNEKDKVENYLHKEVCDGTMTLSQAQKAIATNWYTVYLQISK